MNANTYRDGYRQFNPNYADEDLTPDYDKYLDECEQYDAALALDLELTEALCDDRLEWIELLSPKAAKGDGV